MKQVAVFTLLAFMLISASCTVRNFVQTQLNLPNTSVTNLSKFTTLNQANCLNINEDISISQSNDNPIEITQASVLFLVSFFADFQLVEKHFDFLSIEKWKIKTVPFYLLYQNLKLLD
jgi:hypothetical protein